MTLCIAWTRKGEISFASDSRLTDGVGNIVTDIATKIFTIHVRITNHDRRALLFQANYGLCFTGSYLNGSILADTISELLSSLRMNKDERIGAEVVAQIAFEIYKDVSAHLMSINGPRGLSEAWLAGCCPLKGVHRMFKFSWQYSGDNETIDFIMTEEAWEKGSIAFLGDSTAVSFAEEIKGKVDFAKGYTEYHLLKEVIENEDIQTVGGAIQTGHLLHGDFSLFGMVDYEIDTMPGTEFSFVKPVYTFRGIPLTRAIKSVNHVAIDTNKISMAPFSEKEQQMKQKANEMNKK